MSYCADTDYTTAFGQEELLQLTDRDGDGTPDPGVFDGAAAAASAEIDSYLMAEGRYAAPLTTAPPIVTQFALDITRYRLFSALASDEVTNRYKAAVQWLQNLAKGLVSLGVDPPPAASTAADDDALVSPGKTAFHEGMFREYDWEGLR